MLNDEIEIQVFFTNEKSFKHYNVSIIKTDDLYAICKNGEVVATLERKNVTQIIRI